MYLKKYFSLLIFFVLHYSFANTTPENCRFIENKGQWERKVRYSARTNYGSIFFTDSTFTFLFVNGDKLGRHQHCNHTEEAHCKHQHSQNLPNAFAYQMRFVAANPKAVKDESPFETNYNYFRGNKPEKWMIGAKAYRKIIYKQLYSGIDLQVHENEQGLQYDFIVAPQHNPAQIAIQYEGQTALQLNPKTQTLTIETPLVKVTETNLLAYQIIDGEKKIVPCRWKITGNTASFEFPQGYDTNYELVIDPTLIFSTYSGSFGDNWGNTAAYDSKGNGYAAGTVFWTGFPANLGVQAGFDTVYNGSNIISFTQVFSSFDVGILKFSADGTQLLYASYLGGNWAEAPHSIVVDNNDNLVVMGSTASDNFPTTNTAFDTSFNFGQFLVMSAVSFRYNLGSDIFITKIAENGNEILASTFVGGTHNDAIRTEQNTLVRNYGDEMRGDIIVDSANNIYVATYTSSTDFPMINSFQPFFSGGTTDGVVFKMSNDLSAMIWSNYIGGSGEDALYSIQLDSLNNVIVAGGTSGEITTTPNTIRPFKPGGIDGFISVIASNGLQLLHSTYIGTPALDQVYFVQLDQYENVYVTGQTFGNYPIFTLEDSIYANVGAGHFIHKLNKELNSTIFSTTFGAENSPPQLSLTAFLVDDCDRIYITGWGGNSNQPSANTFYIGNFTFGLPVTPNAQGYVDTITDGSDFYMMVLSRNASELQYGSYFGEKGGTGDHVDGGTCRFDKNGTIYHAVCASCGGTNGFPITPSAWSSVNNGQVYGQIPNCNNALFKIGLAPEILELSFIPASGCAPLLAEIQARNFGNANVTWRFSDGDSVTGNNLFQFNRLFANPGLYTIEMTVNSTNACLVASSISDTLRVFPVPQFDDKQINFCPNDTLELALDNNPQNTHAWSPNLYLNDTTAFNPIATPDSNITYTVSITSPRGCSTTRQVELRKSVPIVQDTSAFLCQGDTLLFSLQNGGLYQLNWQPFTNLSQNNTAQLLIWADTTLTYQVTAFDSLNCSKTIEVAVKVGFTEQVRDTNYVVCKNDSITLFSGVDINSYNYVWSNNQSVIDSATGVFQLPIAALSDSTFIVLITDTNGCTKQETITLQTSIPNVKPDTAFFFCKGDLIDLTLGNSPTYSYEWLPNLYLNNNTVFNPLANPDSSIVYNVKVTDAFNCSLFRTIALNMGLDADFSDTSFTFCKGTTVQLPIQQPDTLFYTWQPASQLNSSTIAQPTIQADSTVLYTVQISDAVGCIKTRNVLVKVSKPELTPDTTRLFCLNEVVSLKAGNPIYNYTWTPSTYLSNSNIHDPTATPQDSITYLVTARDSVNCEAQKNISLHLALPDFPNVNQDFCFGTSFSPSHVPNNINYRYEWLPNEFINDNTIAAPSFTPNRSMNYTVQVTEPTSGCTLVRQFNVNKLPSTLQITSNFKYDDCGAYPIFTFKSNQNDTTGKRFTWYWKNEATQDSAVTALLTRRFLQEGNQSILLKTVEPNGCTDSTTFDFVVKRLIIPNVFSPNEDGENDTWAIGGGEGVKAVDLKIFSRWGKLVYEQDQYNNDWNAQDLPTGTYFYQLKIDNVANCTGWIQVVR